MSDESEEDELMGGILAENILRLMKAGGDLGGLPMWTITEKPSDYPNDFVGRLHVIRDGKATIPASRVVVCNSIEPLRIAFEKLGLVRIVRSPDDDPVIVETWL